METRYEQLNAAFSTADAENPQLSFVDNCLRVSYRDWREKLVSLRFHDVAAFSWDMGDAVIDASCRDDGAYIVHGSKWLCSHHEAGTVMPSENHQHFMFCFNAIGVLQVLAVRMHIEAEASAPI